MSENNQNLAVYGGDKYFFRASAVDSKKIPGGQIALLAYDEKLRHYAYMGGSGRWRQSELVQGLGFAGGGESCDGWKG